MEAKPLILTLSLDKTSFDFFDQQRQRYFPPERNFLSAHLTLFHHFPADEDQVLSDIESIAATFNPMALLVEQVKFMGNAVAYKIASSDLQAIHATLQKKWIHWLIPQDKQKLWPHITVQNKVAHHVARALHEELAKNFVPFTAIGTGFTLWEYEGGPWKFINEFEFVGR